jgi:hypothetical protein
MRLWLGWRGRGREKSTMPWMWWKMGEHNPRPAAPQPLATRIELTSKSFPWNTRCETQAAPSVAP